LLVSMISIGIILNISKSNTWYNWIRYLLHGGEFYERWWAK
jgi:hypothetical protein